MTWSKTMVEQGIRTEWSIPKELGIRMTGKSQESFATTYGVSDRIAHSQQQGYAMVIDGRVRGPVFLNQQEPSDIALASLQPAVAAITTSDPEKVKVEIASAFAAADEAVRAEKGDGTASATVIKIVENDGQRTAVIGSIGNSRAYLLRKRILTQLNQDHRPRAINAYDETVTKALDSIESHDQRILFMRKQFGLITGEYFWARRDHVTQSLGNSPRVAFTPDITEVDLQTGDVLLLATARLHGNLSTAQMQKNLIGNRGDRAAALVDHAYKRSKLSEARSTLGNVSAVVIEVNKMSEQEFQVLEIEQVR